jgi:putative chitinase
MPRENQARKIQALAVRQWSGRMLGMKVNPQLLDAIGAGSPALWAPLLTSASEAHAITTPRRFAAFLANAMHETGGLRRLAENLNYQPRALLDLFGAHRGITPEVAQRLGRTPGKPADQEGIANTIYGGKWGLANLGNRDAGDGWRFRGRGLMQLTGRANNERFARAVGRKLDDAFLASLETPEGAANSAAHFFELAGCNALADANDIDAVRRTINGGTFGIGEVRKYYAAILEKLPPV